MFPFQILPQLFERIHLNHSDLKDIDFLRMENDSLLRKIELQETKVQYFLQQMDMQSNWFIFFVSSVFILFGFVGFAAFKTEISHLIEQVGEDKKVQDGKIHGFEEKFKEFESRVVELDAKIFDSLATFYNVTAGISSNNRPHLSFALKLFELKAATEKFKLNQKDIYEVEKLIPQLQNDFSKAIEKGFTQTIASQKGVLIEMIDRILGMSNNTIVREALYGIRYQISMMK